MSARHGMARSKVTTARDLSVKPVARQDDVYWAVFEDTAQVSGLYPHEHQARRAMESERAKHKPREIKRRPCMCCGVTFDSEGAHHRLCGSCRTQSQPGHV